MTAILALLPGRSAEEAVRTASGLEGADGVVVGPELLAGPGPAALSALEGAGEVLVLAGLHGDPVRAAGAARRYSAFGATWVTVQAIDGPGLVGAVVASGAGVVAVTLRHGQDDAEAAAIVGRSRGRAVSRLAETAAGAGAAGILCDLSDLGVVAQVAPGAERFAWADTPEEALDAAARGADRVIVDWTILAAARAAISID